MAQLTFKELREKKEEKLVGCCAFRSVSDPSAHEYV
jgi:hypothetical protein